MSHLSPAAVELVETLSSHTTWLLRSELPAVAGGYSVEFKEDWSKVGCYANNVCWVRLLADTNNAILAAERARFGIEWYNRELPRYVMSIRDQLRATTDRLKFAVGQRAPKHPKGQLDQWLEGILTSAVRARQLPELGTTVCGSAVELLLAGYVPYDLIDTTILVS